MDAWVRIRNALDRQPHVRPPSGGRLGAVLALLSETDDGDIELVYTRRRDDLRDHPGQISFPGGQVGAGERIEAAAVREAAEEVGLDPATVTVLGRLEAFYIPPSRFWLHTVVARWDHPHRLIAAEAEVAEVLHIPYTRLVTPGAWRAVRSASAAGWFWAWQLDTRHLLWGATAIATAALLDMLDSGWRRGRRVSDLIAAHPSAGLSADPSPDLGPGPGLERSTAEIEALS
jgi:8-oxo-dGTP pyrophosphatase MutT (NUDIX family)